MYRPNLLQLECFVALAAEGSFAAAALRLNKSHPAVHANIKALEDGLGLVLLDRSGYRVELSEAGRSFHEQAIRVLTSHDELGRHAERLARGTETELRIAIGDLCPAAQTLASLSAFFVQEPHTRPVLLSEAIAGPWARLQRGQVELALHHLSTPTPEWESAYLFDVTVLPVAAPGFLPFAALDALEPRQLRPYRQCVIRDSALDWQPISYHVLEGAPSATVTDQASKRELILRGLAWGHMPLHMVESDLHCGRLVSLQGASLQGATLPHYALRRRDAEHGPVAQRLWEYLTQAKKAADA